MNARRPDVIAFAELPVEERALGVHDWLRTHPDYDEDERLKLLAFIVWPIPPEPDDVVAEDHVLEPSP